MNLSKALSTLSPKTATVAEFGDCRLSVAIFGDKLSPKSASRQCGQAITLCYYDNLSACMSVTIVECVKTQNRFKTF